MDQPLRVQLADSRREWDGNAQEFRHLHRPAEQPLERLATGVRQHQHVPDLAPEELDRSRRPVAVEVGPQRVFMLEAPERAGRGVFAGGRNQEDRRQPIAEASIQRGWTLPQRRERIT